jgi:PAS domain S-box-containing protein
MKYDPKEEKARENKRLAAENERLRQELEHTRQLWNKVFHSSPIVMSITTIGEGRFVELNEACAAIGGFRREELLGRRMEELDLLPDPELHARIERKLLTEGRVRNVQSQIRTKNGEVRTVLFSAERLTVDGRECMLATSVDITGGEREAGALRRSEEKYRALVEHSLQGLAIIQDGRIVFCNGTFSAMLGIPAEEMSEIPLRELVRMVHPDDRAETIRRYRARLGSGGSPGRFEFRAGRRDGSTAWIETYTSTVEYDGRPAVQTVTLDITERRRAEEALRDSEEYLELIINRIGDAVFVKDHEHRFLLVNDAFCASIHASREKLLGTDNIRWPIARRLWEEEEEVLATGREMLTEEEFEGPDGRAVVLQARKSLLTDKRGNRQIVGVVRDITEKKLLEAQYQQAQKMEAVGALAGGVAHDFNNLLNVINGYADLLLEEAGPEAPMREELGQIRDAGRRAAALTSQLLDFRRKQMLRPEGIDLARVVGEMQSMIRSMVRENIGIEMSHDGEPARVHADPTKVQQVLMNLVVNAQDAMPGGGRLKIKTGTVTVRRFPQGQRPPAGPGPYVRLAVADTGVGMDPKTREHIFEPFFTTKPKGRGTGLGLATVYGIVVQSGGFVRVTSREGEGTLLEVFFPASGDALPARAESRADAEEGGCETVLLVEDQEAVRALAARVLAARGYRVLEAEDGADALRLARKHQGEIDLVVTDVVMPGMGGPALVERLRRTQPGVPALFISGYTDDPLTPEAIASPANGFLQKPFSPRRLARKVREALDSS